VLAVVIALMVLLVNRRHRNKAIASWRSEAAGALDAARLAQDLLPPTGQEIGDSEHWASVQGRAAAAAQTLDTLAANAPADDARRAAAGAAAAMRGLVFALDSDRLLRDGTQPPTGAQLADADAATRARSSELRQALAGLDAIVHPVDAGAPVPPTAP
jgi:hypothetical protein